MPPGTICAIRYICSNAPPPPPLLCLKLSLGLLKAVLGARMHYGHPDIMNKPPGSAS